MSVTKLFDAASLPVKPVVTYLHHTGKTIAVMPYPKYTGTEPCVGDEAFTRDTPTGVTFTPAWLALLAELRATCDSCPLLIECREYAIAHQTGVFQGGLTDRERQVIARERGQARVEPLYAAVVVA